MWPSLQETSIVETPSQEDEAATDTLVSWPLNRQGNALLITKLFYGDMAKVCLARGFFNNVQ